MFSRFSYKKNALTLLIQKTWHTLYGLINLVIINIFLNDFEIGQYYLMHSILNIQVFAELGFFNIVQANISKTILLESNQSKKKIELKKIMNKYTCLYSLISVIFIILCFFYIAYFSNEENFLGKFKYILYSLCIGLNLYLQLFFTAIDGLNNISKTAEIRIYSTLIGCISIFIFSYLDFGLYSFVFGQLIIAISNIYFIKRLDLFEIVPKIKLKLLKDALQNTYKLQLKYALTWISGYLIFSLYVPFAFKYFGPIQAGIFGMTIACFGIPITIGNALFQARIPTFSILLEEKSYRKTLKIFKKTLLSSVSATFLTGSTLIAIIYFIRVNNFFSDYNERIVPLNLLIIFLIYSVANTYSTCLSLFYRSDNKEIYTKQSLVLAILTFIGIYFTKDFAFNYFIVIPFLIFIFFVITIYTKLFFKRFKEYYQIAK